jgi:serine/threonine protein kinase
VLHAAGVPGKTAADALLAEIAHEILDKPAPGDALVRAVLADAQRPCVGGRRRCVLPPRSAPLLGGCTPPPTSPEAGDADAETRRDLLQRFRLEARAAAVIDHPGIVDVLDMEETDDRSPFIVMEFLEGATLKATLKQLEVLTPGQAVAEMAPVLEALGLRARRGRRPPRHRACQHSCAHGRRMPSRCWASASRGSARTAD